jgi:hypothetical protein
MEGLQNLVKNALSPQRSYLPGVNRRTHCLSVHGQSCVVLFLLVSGAVLFNSPTATAQSVSLTWTASTSAVSGYDIYRGNQSGGPYTLLNSSLIPARRIRTQPLKQAIYITMW